ncbi:MAG: hypothetical protein GY757_48325 [bacterium]|nr:hypothetical protein [bacterium]
MKGYTNYDPYGPLLFFNIHAFDNYAYIGASGNQLLVVDISQPTAPVLVHEFTLQGTAREIDLSTGNAYVRLNNGDIEVVDISTPTALTGVGTVDTGGTFYEMDIQNDMLYKKT